jgi:hypothetical protein
MLSQEINFSTMKNFISPNVIIFTFLLLTMTSCEIIGGIFKAGVWVGIFIVVAVIVIIFWLFRKLLD